MKGLVQTDERPSPADFEVQSITRKGRIAAPIIVILSMATSLFAAFARVDMNAERVFSSKLDFDGIDYFMLASCLFILISQKTMKKFYLTTPCIKSQSSSFEDIRNNYTNVSIFNSVVAAAPSVLGLQVSISDGSPLLACLLTMISPLLYLLTRFTKQYDNEFVETKIATFNAGNRPQKRSWSI